MMPFILEVASDARKRYQSNPGRVLEVGSLDINGTIRDVFQPGAEEYIGVDLTEGPGVDRVINSHHLLQHFSPESFDTICCCETLEHDTKPWITVANMHRLLRPGGLLFISVPSFNFHYHPYPKDYFRFSDEACVDFFLEGLDVLFVKGRENTSVCAGRKPKNQPAVRINLGCGDNIIPGYINVDIANPKADVYGPIEHLAYTDDSVQEVLLAFVLDVLWPDIAKQLLANIYRWLCPGGILVIHSPDLVSCCQNVLRLDQSRAWHDLEVSYFGLRGLYGAMDSQDARLTMKWGFSAGLLSQWLQAVGFPGANITFGRSGLHYHPDRDMHVIATK